MFNLGSYARVDLTILRVDDNAAAFNGGVFDKMDGSLAGELCGDDPLNLADIFKVRWMNPKADLIGFCKIAACMSHRIKDDIG